MEIEVMEKIGIQLVFVLGFIFFASTHGAAKEPEEIWQELSKLLGAERQKQLLSGAKTDGKAVLYGNLNAEQLEKLKVDFEKRYHPELDTEAKGVRVLLLTPDDAVQLEKPYQQLREEFLLRR
jgi:hypothetical protein